MLYKILSYLLLYPNQNFIKDLADAKIELSKLSEFNHETKTELLDFINYLISTDIYVLQEKYVVIFDRNPSLSLYVFDHILGESKLKGQSLADLKEFYQEHHWLISSKELPDFLPLMLEFASQIDKQTAKSFLTDIYEVINDLYLRHLKVVSPYAIIFKSIIVAINKEIKVKQNVNVLEQEDLDLIWKEQEVIFAQSNQENTNLK